MGMFLSIMYIQRIWYGVLYEHVHIMFEPSPVQYIWYKNIGTPIRIQYCLYNHVDVYTLIYFMKRSTSDATLRCNSGTKMMLVIGFNVVIKSYSIVLFCILCTIIHIDWSKCSNLESLQWFNII